MLTSLFHTVSVMRTPRIQNLMTTLLKLIMQKEIQLLMELQLLQKVSVMDVWLEKNFNW
jgi:hypothetical protein